MAFKQAFSQADPQLLEPISRVVVLCPEDLTGVVMGDLQTRRGVLVGMDSEGTFQKITAHVPQAEMHDFSSALRSISQGRAKFSMTSGGYAPVSYELQRRLTDEYNKQYAEATF